tara:strand:- start:21687 stop:22328 length:642 start_codon:yes stop_codon:yes gene_type:complete
MAKKEEKEVSSKTEPTPKNVYACLNKVQTELNAPKNQTNAFGKYKYRSCEDILEGVKGLLKEVGCVIVISDTIEAINDRIYVKATAKFISMETGDLVESTAFARESLSKKGMDDSQVTGATSSYARKYALNGLLLCDDSKDADSMDNSQLGTTPPPAQSNDGDDKEWMDNINKTKAIHYGKEKQMTAEEVIKMSRTKYKVSKKIAEEITEGMK